MRAVALALFCGATLGCNCGPASGHCHFGSTGELPADPAAIEGQPQTLQVPSALNPNDPIACANATVTSVAVTLLDPLNAQVMTTVALSSHDPLSAAAQVRFTPSTPGPYHLSARFEPDLGAVQFDFPVAANRGDAAMHSMPAPADCAFFDVAAGVPLCHARTGALTARFADGGSASVDAGRFSVDEAGRVWTIDGDDLQTIHAYQLNGGAFVELAAQPVEAAVPLALVARGGSAAVVRFDNLEFLRLDGGSFTAQRIPFSQFSSGSDWCLHFTPPSLVVTVEATGSFAPVLINGNGIITQVPLGGIPRFFGADDDGLWWSDGTSIDVMNAVPQDDTGVIHSLAFTGELTAPPGCPESQETPVTSGGGLVPRLSNGQIVLELYPIIGPPLGANSRIVWGIDGGTLYWFDR